MASSFTTGTATESVVYSRNHVAARIHKYHWPAIQLNIWMLFMLIASCVIIGIFATFVGVQHQLGLGVPWYMPYFITVACLTLLFIFGLLFLISTKRLLPSIVILGAFMFFVLWLVGLIVVSIELWGPTGSVSSNCNLLIFNHAPIPATNQANLAWLEQMSQSWQAVFAFALIGVVFLLWMIIIAVQVFYEDSA